MEYLVLVGLLFHHISLIFHVLIRLDGLGSGWERVDNAWSVDWAGQRHSGWNKVFKNWNDRKSSKYGIEEGRKYCTLAGRSVLSPSHSQGSDVAS